MTDSQIRTLYVVCSYKKLNKKKPEVVNFRLYDRFVIWGLLFNQFFGYRSNFGVNFYKVNPSV